MTDGSLPLGLRFRGKLIWLAGHPTPLSGFPAHPAHAAGAKDQAAASASTTNPTVTLAPRICYHPTRMRSRPGLPDPPLLARTHDDLAHHGIGNQDQGGVFSPASSSAWSFLSFSRTSVLVRPVTLRRIREPSGR